MTSRRSILLALLCPLLFSACGGGRAYVPSEKAERREHMEARVADVLVGQASLAAPGFTVVAILRGSTNSCFGTEHDRIMERLGSQLPRKAQPRIWTLPDSPQTEEGYEPAPQRISADWLSARRKESGAVDVVISLYGEPEGEPSSLPQNLPPMVCYAPVSGTNLAAMIRAGVVKAAVAPRMSGEPKNKNDWFDVRFVVLTPENVDTWMP